MPENYEEISDAALALTPGARAMLAGRLLQSIAPTWESDHGTVERVNGPSTSPGQASKMGVSALTLDLTPELEFGLKREAGCRGIPPEQFALEALNEYVALSLRKRADKLAELFRQWNEEEVDESEALDDEFFRNLEENRVAFREITLPE
jgi:hypothetical protein